MNHFRYSDYADILFAFPFIFIMLFVIMFSVLGIILKITKD